MCKHSYESSQQGSVCCYCDDIYISFTSTSISLDSTFLNWLRVHQASISHQMAELNVNIAEVYLAWHQTLALGRIASLCPRNVSCVRKVCNVDQTTSQLTLLLFLYQCLCGLDSYVGLQLKTEKGNRSHPFVGQNRKY